VSGIFVNYRQNYYPDPNGDRRMRRPHGQIVEAIAERFAGHFGPDRVFLDKEIRPAARYPNELRDKLKGSELVVSVIHDAWLEDLVDRARRNGSAATDWVRYELATAFAEGIHVLPVLIDTARLPGRDELLDEFPDIAELGLCQSLRIQAGQWRRDLNRLLVEAERSVSTEPLPQPEQEEHQSARRWRWWWPVLAGLLGLLAPYVVTTMLVAGPRDRWPWLAALAFILALVLAMVLGAMGLAYATRSWMDVVDHQRATMAHDQRTNVIVGLTVTGLAITFLFTSDLFPPMLHMFFLAAVVFIAITIGTKWLYDQSSADQWPTPRLAADPAAIRGAIGRLERHFAQSEPMMTRLQRDQARFALDQIGRSTTRLRTQSDADRRAWLRARPIWLTMVQTASCAATVGAAAGASLAYWESGGRHWSASLWAGGCVVLAVACSLATFDRGYRIQRWRKQVVVDAVPAALDVLERRLVEISVQPARSPGPYTSHPPAIHTEVSGSSGDGGAGGAYLRDEGAPQGPWPADQQD
jgi:hypothetical protein